MLNIPPLVGKAGCGVAVPLVAEKLMIGFAEAEKLNPPVGAAGATAGAPPNAGAGVVAAPPNAGAGVVAAPPNVKVATGAEDGAVAAGPKLNTPFGLDAVWEPKVDAVPFWLAPKAVGAEDPPKVGVEVLAPPKLKVGAVDVFVAETPKGEGADVDDPPNGEVVCEEPPKIELPFTAVLPNAGATAVLVCALPKGPLLVANAGALVDVDVLPKTGTLFEVEVVPNTGADAAVEPNGEGVVDAAGAAPKLKTGAAVVTAGLDCAVPKENAPAVVEFVTGAFGADAPNVNPPVVDVAGVDVTVVFELDAPKLNPPVMDVEGWMKQMFLRLMLQM